MKRLVVHADDLGADLARNRGIFEALEAGSATAASILANGPAFEDAARRARGLRGVSLGLHLNLSEGRPLARGLRALAGADGCFLGKDGARRLLLVADAAVGREVEAEVEAQIAALRGAGLAIDHLDGHQHAHVLPAARAAVVAGARRHGIAWVRVPDEPEGAAHLDDVRLFAPHARALRAALGAAGLRTTDHFRGMAFKDRLDERTLAEAIRDLPDGLTELMTHPARRGVRPPEAGPFAAFCTEARDRELAALLAPAFREQLAALGVALTPFPSAAAGP